MSILQSKTIGKWFTGSMIFVLVLSLTLWFLRRDTMPRQIRVAGGPLSSQYHEFCKQMAPHLIKNVGRTVKIDSSAGSVENLRRLRENKADIAMLQSDAVTSNPGPDISMKGISIVAPLYPEVIHVISSKDSGINSIVGLDDKDVFIGSEQSGMRVTAESIISYYQMEVNEDFLNEQELKNKNVWELFEAETVDAAIITTGVRNKSLHNLLKKGKHHLLSIDHAEAIAAANVHLRTYSIPIGLYSGGADNVTPLERVTTIATTAVLAVPVDASDTLVLNTVRSLYEEDLPVHFPDLIPRNQALEWSPVPLHSAARAYYDPVDQIGWYTSVMESLVATKELLFALGAGLYLTWHRWRKLKEREAAAVIKVQKERLDAYLSRTLEIERQQIGLKDREELSTMLGEVTKIKLQALGELTHEELRGDQMFSIFLIQCANLISKIQLKIIARPQDSNDE